MQRIIKTALVLSVICAGVLAQGKHQVAVYMSGKNQTDPQSEIVEFALTEVLSESQNFTATERTREFLNTISKEQLYQHSGAVDGSQIAALGKKSGVAYVCVAELVKFSPNEFLIIARLIDVELAVIVGSAYRIAVMQNNADLLTTSKILAKALIADFDGRDRNVPRDRVAIYLAEGRSDGISVTIQPLLIHAVSRGNQYAVSERTGAFMESLSKELGHQYSGEVDDDQLTRLGYQAGVKYIMALKVASRVVNVRLIDVTTGDIEKSRTGTMNTVDAKSIEKSVVDLISQFLGVDALAEVFTELKEDIVVEGKARRAQEEQMEREEKAKAERERRAEKERLRKLAMPDPQFGFAIGIHIGKAHEVLDVLTLSAGIAYTHSIFPNLQLAPQVNVLLWGETKRNDIDDGAFFVGGHGSFFYGFNIPVMLQYMISIGNNKIFAEGSLGMDIYLDYGDVSIKTELGLGIGLGFGDFYIDIARLSFGSYSFTFSSGIRWMW